MGDSFNGKIPEGGYECKICDFRCSYKSNYDIHISTRKHQTMVKHEGLLVETAAGHSTAQTAIPSNTCRYCNKRYAHLSALSRHKKTCPMTTATETVSETVSETATATTTQNITHDMYNKLIGLIEEVKNSNKNSDSNTTLPTTAGSDENIKVNVTDFQNTLVHTTNFMKEMMLMMTTQLHSKMMEISKHNNNDPAPATAPSSIGVATNGNHNTINSNNNTFNMNMFLNDKCKDAMNMKDFVNSIQLNLTDLENVGNLGYVKGMSNILIDNLQKMDVYKRPVHCSDVKRDTLYVKENNEWERDGPDHPKMVNAVLAVEHKNVALVSEWAKANPRCMNSNTRENERYMKLSKAATDGEKEGNIAKVIKKVAKNVAIEKKETICLSNEI